MKNLWTQADDDRLRREYSIFREVGRLQVLADSMGRTRHFICRKARDLGLTDQAAARPYIATWKYMSEEAAEAIWNQFKASSLGLKAFCTRYEYDDLGFSRTMHLYFGDEWDHVIESKAPKQSMYRLGRRLEYTVRDDLKAHGFFVLRSPQSRSPVDLVAIAPKRVVFVQCKRSGAMGVAEWNEFYDLAVSVDAEPVLASTPTGRGTRYQRLIGRKDGSKRRQPLDEWTP